MPELRKDPIVDRWVIFAPERARRPFDHPVLAESPRAAGVCPFCEGNEASTPSELLAERRPDTCANQPGWSIRVIPNQFPALDDQPHSTTVGVHDVIIECPQHESRFEDLSPGQIHRILDVYRRRMAQLAQDPRLVFGMLFKNAGASAGASLEHCHSQLLALDHIPTLVAAEHAAARFFWDANGRCLFCDLLERELALGDRIVLTTEHFVCLTPYASRFALEMWIVPRRHSPAFEMASELEELAAMLRRVLRRLQNANEACAYNFYIHTDAWNGRGTPAYHWHLEILPRKTGIAGFEWGTGCYINAVFPEDAAQRLRQAEE